MFHLGLNYYMLRANILFSIIIKDLQTNLFHQFEHPRRRERGQMFQIFHIHHSRICAESRVDVFKSFPLDIILSINVLKDTIGGIEDDASRETH
jgi:hypothetical protein